MQLTFLHTAEVHVQRFQKLVEAMDTSIGCTHIVNEDLLKYYQQNKKPDLLTFYNELEVLKKTNPDKIICTCSSYGKFCDETIESIDARIIQYLAQTYKSILLVYTTETTKQVSIDTLYNWNSRLDITLCDVSHAWNYFDYGNYEAYYITIANAIRKSSLNYEAIFLAQASMDKTIEYLNDIEIPIYSTPYFGIKQIVEELK